jgi:uncharacterized protein (DUF305 family)
MSSKSIRILAAVVLTVGATLTSCGRPASGPPLGNTAATAATNEQPAPHNAADVAFARNMIPHHQQGVELAALVPVHTLNRELRVIAAHIGADQQAEVRTLNLLLTQWHEPADTDYGNGAAHDRMPMAGMVDQSTMDRLKSLDGAAFDTLWVTSMISHHQGAITMAQNEIAHGQSADAIHAAVLIVEAQQREISTMTHLISATQ